MPAEITRCNIVSYRKAVFNSSILTVTFLGSDLSGEITSEQAIELLKGIYGDSYVYSCINSFKRNSGERYYVIRIKCWVENHFTNLGEWFVSFDGKVCVEGYIEGTGVRVYSNINLFTAKEDALQAYYKMLSADTMTFYTDYYSGEKHITNREINPSNSFCKFAIAYVDGDKIPELIVEGGEGTSHATGSYNLFTYRNGKVEFLYNTQDDFTYYEKTGIFSWSYTGMGTSTYKYYDMIDYYTGTLSSDNYIVSKECGDILTGSNKWVYSDRNENKISELEFYERLVDCINGRDLMSGLTMPEEESPIFYENIAENRKNILGDFESNVGVTIAEIEAYAKIINEYKAACAEDSEDWQNNLENYMQKYPDVDSYVMRMYHTPSHYDEWLESDEPYEIAYMYYDIDRNGIQELVLSVAHHELVPFAVFTFDGKKAVDLKLANSEEYGSYSIYTNGVFAVYNEDINYYELNKDGYTPEKIALTLDEIDELLGYQLITNITDWNIIANDVPVIEDIKVDTSSKNIFGLIVGGISGDDNISSDNDQALIYTRLRDSKIDGYQTNISDIHLFSYNNTNNPTTKSVMKKKIQKSFSGTSNNDISYFYYSGHSTWDGQSAEDYGITLGDGAWYKWYDLAFDLASVCKGKIIVILDACFSKCFYTYGILKLKVSDQNRFIVLTSSSEVQGSSAGNVLNPIFTKVTGKKVSYGKFTYNIGKAIGFFDDNIFSADSDKNNAITAQELYDYLLKKLPKDMTTSLFAQNPNMILFRYPVSLKIKGEKNVTLKKGKTKTLKVHIENSNKKVKWKSSNKKVVSVNSVGKIKGKTKGTAVITATLADAKAKFKVVVKK